MSELSRRFPKGDLMLRAALTRERVPLGLVRTDMLYTGVSWALRVDCDSVGYRRQEVLCPYDLWADTAFNEMCQSIAEDLAERLRDADQLSRPGVTR